MCKKSGGMDVLASHAALTIWNLGDFCVSKQSEADMNDRDDAGRFTAGNRFWEARSSAGPKPKFADAETLWAACCEYFDWAHSNPLYADQLVTFQGTATHEPVAKMRAMTIGGLCIFLDIDETTWRDWKDTRPDLSPIVTRAEAIIYQQKFTGAAADLLNGSIIARDLGLADKKDHTSSDGSMTPHPVTALTDEQLARIASGDGN